MILPKQAQPISRSAWTFRLSTNNLIQSSFECDACCAQGGSNCEEIEGCVCIPGVNAPPARVGFPIRRLR